ncbi:MAG: hypothetical protein FJ086_06480 [Deltaproteobacteria bacterium]|nr:hypothetical protein [Deltaproteobacteria bacterium]
MARQAAVAQVSLLFDTGYLATIGTGTNKANSVKPFSTLGILRAGFFQADADGNGLFGGTQGNDLAGVLKIYLSNGTILTLNGALNFREPTGSKVEIFGFIFDPGQTASIPYGASQTYTITGGTTNGSSTSMGLRAYTSTFTFVDGENRNGNASMSGLLADLNLALTGSPQPTVISACAANAVEGALSPAPSTSASPTTGTAPSRSPWA